MYAVLAFSSARNYARYSPHIGSCSRWGLHLECPSRMVRTASQLNIDVHICECCTSLCILSTHVYIMPCFRNAGWTRDQLLEDMRVQYVDWCRKTKINGSYMAANRLWTTKILKPKSGEYPSVSQKVMKGAAARVLVHWCAGVSHAHATNTNSEKDWYEPRFLTLHIQYYTCCIC